MTRTPVVATRVSPSIRSRVVPWLIPVVVVAEVVLVVCGRLGVGTAAGAAVVIELLLVAAVLGHTAQALRRFRAGRAAGLDRWSAAENALARLVPRRLAQLILLEACFWACLARWVSRRHQGRDPFAFSYHRGRRAVTTTMFTLVLVEGAAVEILLALVVPHTSWPWIALAAHLYGLVWLLGLHASLVTRPHLLSTRELRLRDGVHCEVLVPRDAVRDARLVTRPGFGRSGCTIDESQHTATLAHGDINVAIALRPGRPITVNGVPADTALTTLWITVDNPTGLIRALRHTGTGGASCDPVPPQRTGRVVGGGRRRQPGSSILPMPGPERLPVSQWRKDFAAF